MIKTERKTELSALELKKWMMKIAMSHMTHYQTDLVYDFEIVDNIEERGLTKVYSWQIRDTGTNFVRIDTVEGKEFAASFREYNDYESMITYNDVDGFAITEAMKI